MKTQSNPRSSTLSLLKNSFRVITIIAFLGNSNAAFSQLELLKDVDTNEDRVFNEYSWFVSAGNYMFFVSNNELWKSNGTTRYTVKMKSFTSISNLTIVGTTLYFTADDGTTGQELWKSNGSPGNTMRVKDIKPGSGSSSPSYLTNVNGVLFFAAHTDDKGIELWKSDGTAAGTTLVKDISRGSANPRNLKDFNGTLFFSATSPAGYELWKSDGTSANTVLVKDIVEGKGSSNPARLTVSNNRLYFVALHPYSGRELWVSDGTTSGTNLLKDIMPGTRTSTPENLIHANGKLMFTANDGVHGDELWSSDGTTAGTSLVKDMNPGSEGSNNTNLLYGKRMGRFTNINGVLYFMASKNSSDYFYRSDGTDVGTVIITEAFGVLYNEPNPEFIYRNGYVYFFNAHPFEPHIYSLYKMPYKGWVITRIKDFEVDQEDWGVVLQNNMLYLNGALFFTARFSEGYYSYGGYELIRTDGTPEGTVSIHDTYAPTMSSQPSEMITVSGRVYSLHYSFLSYTPQLYSTDGTPEGTFELRPERYQYEWEAVGDRLFFLEDYFTGEERLWQISVTAGTPASTAVVISGAMSGDQPGAMDLTDVNGKLYFFNNEAQIFRSDGTTAGTQMVEDLDGIYSITNVNGQAFILASNASGQLQLWKTNSLGEISQVTSWNNAGTVPFTSESGAMEVGGVFYFLMFEWGSDYQIWRSNGTAEGTYKMFGPDGFKGEPLQPWYGLETLLELNDELYFSNGKALYKASEATYTKIKDLPGIRHYAEFNDKMILFTNDYNQEVYASDGTPDGTILLLARPVSSYFQTDHAIAGEYLYFNSHDETLYRTDGTACGTTPIDVGAEKPYALEAIGEDLVFGGYKHETGTELYVYHNVNSIPGNECDETVLASQQDVQSESKILSSYPNPFTESFTLKVDGKENERAEVAVFTASGFPVEVLNEISVNRVYRDIGAQWPRGLDIVKVRRRGRMETIQVFKE